LIGNSLQAMRTLSIFGTISLYALVAYVHLRKVALERRKLVEARDVAEQANQAKSTFLAVISHEIRTPLAALIGYADLLRISRQLDSQSQTSVERIHSHSRYLLSLIENILDMR